MNLSEQDLMMGYKRKALDEAFKLVQPPGHWKNPIDAIIPLRQREVVEASIIFFTGSVPHFTHHTKTQLRVRADGYFKAIGA